MLPVAESHRIMYDARPCWRQEDRQRAQGSAGLAVRCRSARHGTPAFRKPVAWGRESLTYESLAAAHVCRRLPRSAATVSLVCALMITACGSNGNSTSAGSKAASSSQAASAPVTVNKSVVQSAPGGSKVKVTLVSYEPQVPESSHDALAPEGLWHQPEVPEPRKPPVKANSPTYYSVLRLANTAGSTTVAHARGPCEGQFDSAPLHLAAHGSTRGCIPYSWGNSQPVNSASGSALSSSSGTFAPAEASTLVGPPDPRAGGRSQDASDARALQKRRDSIIGLRVALQTAALVLLTHTWS